MAPKDAAPSHLPRCFPLWPGLLAGLFATLLLYEVRTLPWLTDHLPAAMLHPLSLAGQGLLLAVLVTLCGDWLRLRAGRRDLRRLEQHKADAWAGAALADDLLAAGFPERLQTLPASPEDAREAEEALDADCEAEFAVRVQHWVACLRRRWRRYWLLAFLLLPTGFALTFLGLHGVASVPRREELFLPLDVATVETVVVCLLALWLRRGWQRLLAGWRQQAGTREAQLALFPELVLPGVPPEGFHAGDPEAETGDAKDPFRAAGGAASAAPEGEPVFVVEWCDLAAEPAAPPAPEEQVNNPGPTKLSTPRPTVLGHAESPPPEKRRAPAASWQGDLQLVEDDEA
jgi:hypothetical protein